MRNLKTDEQVHQATRLELGPLFGMRGEEIHKYTWLDIQRTSQLCYRESKSASH